MFCVAYTHTHTHVCLRFLDSWMKTVAMMLSTHDVPGTLPWLCRLQGICCSGSRSSHEAGIIMTLILQMRNFKFQRRSNFFSFTQLVILGKIRIQTQVFLILELELFLMLYCLKASNMSKHTHTWACTHTCHPLTQPHPHSLWGLRTFLCVVEPFSGHRLLVLKAQVKHI